MIEVATEAGLSRAWLYRQFPDKASLVVAALVRTDEAFWADAHARVSGAPGLAAQVAEAVALSREHRPGALLLELQARGARRPSPTLVGTGLRRDDAGDGRRSGTRTSKRPVPTARSEPTSTSPGPASG